MNTFTYTVQDQLGIHARPAGLLVKIAKRYNSSITLECGGKSIDLRRLMALMTLCVKCGDAVTVTAEGVDAEAAVDELQAFFAANL